MPNNWKKWNKEKEVSIPDRVFVPEVKLKVRESGGKFQSLIGF